MSDDVPDVKTYSLAEVAKMVLPQAITDGVRWLSRRLNRGELSGYRVGRTWRMTREDVEGLIGQHRERRVPPDARNRELILFGLNADFAPAAEARRCRSMVIVPTCGARSVIAAE